MDYDDDDISRHNIQLASEGRSRSSSVLKPYEFPKFDFDDSLQGHLRFDSLVETEVFLGIQSQEDNQWIEGYSQVSNGMEFNPTPADSCPISRRDNVWSEATSSESVEMLLKSVGQEEMIPAANIILRADVCDGQGASARHGESDTDLDMRNSDTMGPRAEVHNNLSQNKPLEEQSHLVEISSLNSANVGSSSEHSQVLIQDTGHGRSDLLSHEGQHDIGPGDESLQEPKAVDRSEVAILSTSVASLQKNANVLHASVNESVHERHVSIGTGLQDNMNFEGKPQKNDVDTSARDGTPCLVLESKVEDSADVVNASLDCPKPNVVNASLDCPKPNDSGSISSKKECELMFSAGDVENVSLRNLVQIDDCEVKNLAISSDMEIPDDGCRDVLSLDGSNQHSAELDCFAAHTSTDLNMDSSMQLIPKRDNCMSVDVQTSQSETHLLVEDDKVSKERDGSTNNTDVAQSIYTDLVSSDAENLQSKKAEGCVNDSDSTQERLGDYVSGESGDLIKENLSHAQAEFSATREAIGESKENDWKLSVNPGNINLKPYEPVSSNLGTPVCEDEVVKGNDNLQDIQNQTSGGIKADKLEPHARSNVMVAVTDRLENVKRGLSVIGFPHLDNIPDKDGIAKIADAHHSSGAGSASEVEAACDSAQTPLSEVTASTCLQSAKDCNEMSISQSPSSEATNSTDLDNQNVNIGYEKSNMEEKCDAVLADNHNIAMNLGGDGESTQVAEVDKASCGSPTIISSSEPSRMENTSEEDARGSEVIENVVKESQPTSEDVKGKDVLGDDNSFTFRVTAIPDATQEPGKSWSPLHEADKCDSIIVAKESAPSCKGKKEKLPSPRTPRQSTQMTDKTDVQPSQGTSKGIYERKRRRATKDSAKKGSQAKGTNQENSAGIIDKGLDNSLSTPNSSAYVQFGSTPSYGNVEESSKLSPAGISPTSSPQDLNATALNKSSSMLPTSRLPFTDMQQVQLRAQIFVYGSLIQGTAPDEACMISAFGPSDAGRSSWDPVWRTAIERVRAQKSSSSNPATPLHSQSGARASDLSIKHSSHLSKVQTTPVSKTSSKDTTATIASPMIPLSSPLWSISTPSRDILPSSTMHKGPVVDFQQAVAPLLPPYQTPPLGNFSGHTSWPSHSCFPGPAWLASPQNTSFSPSVRFQPVTMTETVKLTPVKDNTLPLVPGVKHVKSTLAANSVGPGPVHVGVSSARDTKTIPPELHSSDLKPRKKKKISASDNFPSVSASEPQSLPMVIHSVDALQSSLVGASAPAISAPVTPLGDSAVCSTTTRKICESDTMKADVCSEDTLENINDAKTHAENAAVFAANAVAHCEDLWGKLAKQKESGSTPELETKLISAAATIAAAASVAKAAAAAAKVAFNAALQAKLLADEAFLSGEPDVVVPSNAKSSTNLHNVGNAMPASILNRERSSTKSNSILVAAKEAAKRRVEAASAASKQAENLDAIVKAAELAASAVSQAGKIVAMGEPLPLADLMEAGPDGYWKLPQTSVELGGRLRDENKEQSVTVDLKEVVDVHGKASIEDSAAKGGSKKRSRVKPRQRGEIKDSMDTRMSSTDGLTGSLDPIEMKSSSSRDGEKSIVVTSQREKALRSSSMQHDHGDDHEYFAVTHSDESIKEGSPVEVFKCNGNLKSAWYSAKVLKVEDRKAYVCYIDLSSGEGSGNLCEWVCLEGEGEKAPVIRASHPSNSLQYQGTRKRRRAALGEYAWGIGDKVDVWIDDCWWEGVVTERNDKDETTLKVHFPAQGETSIVRAWNLRTSRSWIDGKWVECSSWRLHHSSDQSDTPQEKRQKKASPKVKDITYDEGKMAIENPVETKMLPLSTSERKFDIGKNTKENFKGIARRPPLKSGQQKEGSRVVFGVPKPTGKMRKFMEVGKNFPTSKGDKSTAVPDKGKFAKHIMPQTTVSQGWKVPSRSFSRETRTVESKPKVPTTRKSHRTLPQRDNLGSKSGDLDGKTDLVTDVKDSGGFSVTDESAEAPLSSLLSHSLSAGSKRVPLSNSRSGRLNRGKVGPSGKLSKIEEEKVGSSDLGRFDDEATEPRRSNRRFQPTHRLLEGLQSSMVIPKLPSVSQKPQRNPSRNVFSTGK